MSVVGIGIGTIYNDDTFIYDINEIYQDVESIASTIDIYDSSDDEDVIP